MGGHPRLAALRLEAGRAPPHALRQRGGPVLRGQRRRLPLDAARARRSRVQRVGPEQPGLAPVRGNHGDLRRPERPSRRALQGDGGAHVLVGPGYRGGAVGRGTLPAHQGGAGAGRLPRPQGGDRRRHARLDLARRPALDAAAGAAGEAAGKRRHIGPLRRAPRRLLRLHPADGVPRRAPRRHRRQPARAGDADPHHRLLAHRRLHPLAGSQARPPPRHGGPARHQLLRRQLLPVPGPRRPARHAHPGVPPDRQHHRRPDRLQPRRPLLVTPGAQAGPAARRRGGGRRVHGPLLAQRHRRAARRALGLSLRLLLRHPRLPGSEAAGALPVAAAAADPLGALAPAPVLRHPRRRRGRLLPALPVPRPRRAAPQLPLRAGRLDSDRAAREAAVADAARRRPAAGVQPSRSATA